MVGDNLKQMHSKSMMDNPKETVVIMGCWRQSLSVIRSLGRAGYRVELIQQPGSHYLKQSRYLHHSVELADYQNQPQAFLTGLQQYLAAKSGTIYFYPIGDTEIVWTLQNQANLPRQIEYILPSQEVINICASKQTMYQYAEDAKVPCMQSHLVHRADEIFQAAEKVGFPLLIKADNEATRIHGKKAIICQTADELQVLFADWEKQEHPLIVQTYFIAPRYNVYFFAVGGEMLIDAQIKILRTDMFDDTGLAVDGVAIPSRQDLSEYTRALVTKLGYHGAGCAQFLVDEQQAMFLEINSRLGANFAAVYQSGLDLPRLSLELVAGRPVQALVDSFRIIPNNRYAWFYGDILGFLRAIFRRQIKVKQALQWMAKLVQTQLKANLHITWDKRDPMPSFWIWYDRIAPWRVKPSL